MDVAELTVKPAAFTDPNCTDVALRRLAPEIVTGVPPAEGPEIGLTPVTDGGPEFPEAYVKRSAAVTGLVPAGVVTGTSTTPCTPAGAVTVLDVAVNAVGARYEKLSAAVMELVPLGDVTVTSTVPVPAGAVAVMDVAEPTVKDVAATNPNRTAVAPVKAAPATVTCVPPASGPEEGLIA